MLHYQMMVEMEGVQAPAPPDDVAKLSLHVPDVSFSTTLNSYTMHIFCNTFNFFQNLMYIFIVDRHTCSPLLVQQPLVTVDGMLTLTMPEDVQRYLQQMSPAAPRRAPTATLGAPMMTTSPTTVASTMVQTKSI